MVDKSREEVVVQFTGGKDSTYLAFLMANQFKKVHLLTFHHSLIKDMEKAWVNVYKLQRLFGRNKFKLVTVDIEDLLRKLYQADFLRDLIRYRGYGANNLCGACRLSMITHTIIYCLQNRIKWVRDGSNVSGFDLSQQRWGLPLIKEFYSEFGIDYETPLYENRRNDVELLKLGLFAENPTIFFRSQPRCEGGGHFHNIYLRCHFLPLYGGEALRRMGTRWLRDKIEVCRGHIDKMRGLSIIGFNEKGRLICRS